MKTRLISAVLGCVLVLMAGLTTPFAHADEEFPAPEAAQKAADYIAENVDTDASAGGLADAILGLASAKAHKEKILEFVEALEPKVADYATAPCQAAKMLLIALIAKKDPTSFGGVDVLAKAKEDEQPVYDFCAGLTAVALLRAGEQTLPPKLDSYMKNGINDEMTAFARKGSTPPYELDGAGMYLTAMNQLGKNGDDVAAAKALKLADWLETQQLSDGSDAGAFPHKYSKENVTGMVSPALAQYGRTESAAKATAWMKTRQDASGAIIYNDEPNMLATVQGIFSFTNNDYFTAPVIETEDTNEPEVTPGDSGAPAEPGDNATPAEPGDSGAPAEPGDNGAPAEPGDSGAPAEPGDSGTPAEPGDNGAPAEPGDTGAPAEPGNTPETQPDASETPVPPATNPEPSGNLDAPAEPGEVLPALGLGVEPGLAGLAFLAIVSGAVILRRSKS